MGWRRTTQTEWTVAMVRNVDAIVAEGGMSHRMHPRVVTHLGHRKDGAPVIAMITPRGSDGTEKVSRRRFLVYRFKEA